jgi:Electron transfer DM13
VRSIGRLVRRRPWWAATVGFGLAGFAAFVLLYFAPQDLFLQTSVDEPLPTAAVTAAGAGSSQPAELARSGAGSEPSIGVAPRVPAPVLLARGRFPSGEHDTSGRVRLLRLADGRAFVRLDKLSTSNGPAVRVWLSTAAAGASDDAVGSAVHLDVGGLKANHGNQNYRVPDGAALGRYRSVVIWCRRFDVVFGSAALAPA